ncbi:hypothetical protein N7465_010577 [Penicillium sp. CMV-2018d]|nr:hypothetical protein N7465_010577 [Penicillium sp. CMV-2018d]
MRLTEDQQADIVQILCKTPLNCTPSTETPLADGMPRPSADSIPEIFASQCARSRSTYISERSVDEPRKLKMIYIGAGISGIVGEIEFMKRLPDLDLVVYEKNSDIGGTWFENMYPGCACDVPSHSYQLSFESWTKWKNLFAGAPEILEYWKRIADKYQIRRHVRLDSKCVGARWSETASKWIVQIHDLKTGTFFQDEADVLMTGEGVLNEWKWPDIPGIHTFKGKLLHSANWDTEFDTKNKAVAVIGAGSSGIQIVPALEPDVKSMDHYIRGRTWISNGHGAEEIKERTEGKGGNFSYSDEEHRLWEHDREAYLDYRRKLEVRIQSRNGITHRGSQQQAEARASFTSDMQERLKSKPDIIKDLIPNFSPLCKRLTPGPGYLEALTSPKVNVITTSIDRIDQQGIVTSDGVHHPVDAIVCATGFQAAPGARGFPIIGCDNINLRERYAQRPETYLGICTDKFPNFFQSLGPNAFQGAGNLLIMIEATHSYIGHILEKLVYENVGTIEPKRECVEGFTDHCDEYFKRTVFTDECDSWYKSAPPGATREEKRNGRVTALWPGSSLHAIRTLRSVRWEDFDMKYYDGNKFGWFGNGWTVSEKNPSPSNVGSFSWYLNNTNILTEQ